MSMSVNGVSISGATLQEIADAVNAGQPGLGTVSAALDTNGDLVLTDAVGNDLTFGATGGATDTFEVAGTQGTNVTVDTSGANVATVGGTIEFTLGEGVTMANASPAVNDRVSFSIEIATRGGRSPSND